MICLVNNEIFLQWGFPLQERVLTSVVKVQSLRDSSTGTCQNDVFRGIFRYIITGWVSYVSCHIYNEIEEQTETCKLMISLAYWTPHGSMWK